MSTVLNPTRGVPTAGTQPLRTGDVRLKRLHVFIVMTLALGLFCDSVELIMTNVLATVFSVEPAVSKAEVTRMLASLFVGGAIGAPIIGRLSDRYGRRPALLAVIAAYGCLSVGCGLSANIVQLTVLRFFCGMALAAFLPLTWTYLAEVLPAEHRGRMVMIVGAVGAVAASVTPLLTRWGNEWLLLGLEGWRLTLLMGGCGGLLVFLLALRMPESPRWLEAVGRPEAVSAVLSRFGASRPLSTAALTVSSPDVGASRPQTPSAGAADQRFVPRLLLLFGLQLLQPLAIIGFSALSGVVMRQKGVDLNGSLVYLAVSGIGAPLGALTASLFVDRFARHALYAGCCFLLAMVGLGFGMASSTAAAMVLGGVYLFMIVVFAMTLNLYAAEMFSARRRGLATGLGYSVHRAGAAMVPLVLLPLLLEHGPLVLFSVIAGALVVSALLVLLFGPRGTAGQTLH